jgi:hypothetical protein
MGRRNKLDNSVRNNRIDYRFYSDALLRQRIKAKESNISAIDTVDNKGRIGRWFDRKYRSSLARKDIEWLKRLGDIAVDKLIELAADAPKLILVFIFGLLIGERRGKSE